VYGRACGHGGEALTAELDSPLPSISHVLVMTDLTLFLKKNSEF
jgi:hypothetical protein